MVGLVIVSHSEALAQGVVQLAREMGGAELAIEAAGGIDEPGVLGTDAERVRAAIETVMSDDGVLVLMDLGSALMSAEFAIEMLAGGADRVRLSEAPLVEGAVAAAASAAGGATLDEVASEARGALRMKASQLGQSDEVADEVADGAADGVVDVNHTRVWLTSTTAELTVRNAAGLHARPAARFVAAARQFDAEVRVARPGGDPVSARSLTNVVALGARQGETVVVSARGPQASEALAALRALADDGFGDTLGEPVSAAAAPPVTVSAATAPGAGDVLRGVGISGGIVVGPARRVAGAAVLNAPEGREAESPEHERSLLDEAIAVATGAVSRDREAVAGRTTGDEAEIFDAQLALLSDEALLDPAHAAIAAGAAADAAWFAAVQDVATIYRGLSEPILRERAVDVLDVGRRVLRAFSGQSEAEPARGQPGIAIVDELTPAAAAALDVSVVTGIATAHGTATAHGAILARALGLPTVMALGDAVLQIANGATLLLDGDAGTLTFEPAASVRDEALGRSAHLARRRDAARARAREAGALRDGTRVEVFANLGGVTEAAEAVALGAEGVGLLRTEFLYLERAELPSEDEQVATLRTIATALDGRPLIVRTLDAGADKPMAGLPMAAEANPFLGVRGIRASLAHRLVLAAQLRAIVRVAAEFPAIKVMVPMVATVDEVVAVREMLVQAGTSAGLEVALELGIMVEVPAAALTAAALAEHVDFFSVGTNDLTQYTMAADRGNERLASLLDGLQPAVLALIRATVEAATARGRWVGVCGELAGDPQAAVVLAGLGVTELSMAPSRVPEVKGALREVDLDEARAAATRALDGA